MTDLKKHEYFIYLLSNCINTVIYVGMTNDLGRRTYEHQKEVNDGFTKKYKVHKLVYFECTNDVLSAISREKEIKKWRREKKIKLVESINPLWKDLSEDLGINQKHIGRDFSVSTRSK